jgi:hypothetical protein
MSLDKLIITDPEINKHKLLQQQSRNIILNVYMFLKNDHQLKSVQKQISQRQINRLFRFVVHAVYHRIVLRL